jgi:hypothetical protein
MILKPIYWYLTDPSWRQEFKRRRRRRNDFQKKQRQAIAEILDRHGDTVIGGPFKGMRFPVAHRKTSYCAQVLLGTYEKELSCVIEEICSKNYSTIVDIGAADGYYVGGFAMRNTNSQILGFEADTSKHMSIHQLLRANSIHNVEIHGFCDSSELRQLLRRNARVLLMVDIDGGEMDLLDPAIIEELQRVDILVETHDILKPGITSVLVDRFTKTHDINFLESRERGMIDLPPQVNLNEEMAIAAMDEFRGGMQIWMWMKAKYSFLDAITK